MVYGFGFGKILRNLDLFASDLIGFSLGEFGGNRIGVCGSWIVLGLLASSI